MKWFILPISNGTKVVYSFQIIHYNQLVFILNTKFRRKFTMAKFTKILITSFMVLGSLFISKPTSAATSEVYYSSIGNSTTSPGIYKSIPNGTSKTVLKSSIYTKKKSGSPITFQDAEYYYANSRIATTTEIKTDNIYSLNKQPVRDVQPSGKNVYFTKFMYEAKHGYGGGADVLQLYKRDSQGKVTRVGTDSISSDTAESFVISGSNLYYAKITNKIFGNFTIVKSSLDGKYKTALQRGVDDFWIDGKYIYFVKTATLYRMGMDGRNVTAISGTKSKLYGMNCCGDGNYFVSENGVVIGFSKRYFYDFTTNKVTEITSSYKFQPIDVDLTKKRILGYYHDNAGQRVYALYDFNGKLLKKVITFKGNWWHSNINMISYDVKTRVLLYAEGTKLKQINF
jgi:hypothetical protein